ncbi:TPA: hypothetical protein DEP90_02440, partial [Patescibacteria group bacterium]|nr:hypothetical protein [Patescibacteria group bacterium]
GVIPIFGWIIYLIVRPSETIDEIYWGDLERRYLKYETSELDDCPKCGTQLYPGFIFCPNCGYVLKVKCPQCSVYVDINHKYCINCGYQMKDRAVTEESPDTKVMQQQIEATKEEAHESVKAKKSRYKFEINFVSRIGKSVIRGYKLLGKKVKERIAKKEEVEKPEIKKEDSKIKQESDKKIDQFNKQKEIKKKKRKRRKKKRK